MAENRNCKMHLALFLLILMPLTIAGCWGRRETQQMNLSTALGFDRIMVDGNPRFRFTVLSTKTPQGGGGGMGASGGISEPKKSSASQVISIDGSTLWDAGRNWQMRSSRKLFLGQVIVVVVGEETARDGLGEIMDFLLRHQDIRERVWIVVCKGLAADFLNSQPEEEPILSTELDGILKNAWTRTAKVRGIDLFNYSYALLTPGKEAVLPYMTLFVPPEPSSPIRQNLVSGTPGADANTQNSSEAEQGNQPQRKTLEATGFAVFQGNRMVDLINEEESQGLLFLSNQVKTAAIPIAFNASEKNVSIRLEGSKTKIKPVIYANGIKFEVNIKASGNLMESDTSFKISKEDWKKVEELTAIEIERRCREAVRISQELKSDVLGFGDKIHRSNPRAWKGIKDNWKQIFPTVTVNVKVEFKLKQTGVFSDPIKVQ